MSEEFNPFAAGEILRLCPTTAPQREILASEWFGDEANTAFNEAISVRIEEPLDAPFLSRYLDALVECHEMLRSSFVRNRREVCLQSLLRPRLQVEDWTSLTFEQQTQALSELWRNIGKLLQPYLRGTPEEAPIPADTFAQPSPPDTERKPLWRGLFG